MRDLWAEGKYVDLWSVNHLLSGFIAAGWMMVLHFPTWANVLIASLLFWGWEIFERVYEIEEISNQVFDIITDYAGYGLFFIAAAHSEGSLIGTLSLTSFAFLALELWGFVAYKKRGGVR